MTWVEPHQAVTRRTAMTARTEFSAVSAAGASIGTSEDTRNAKEKVLNGETIDPLEPREADPSEIAILKGKMREGTDRQVEQLTRNLPAGGSLEERVQIILRRASISRSRTGFGDREAIEPLVEAIHAQLQHGGRLTLGLLLGGAKAPNALKTGGRIRPDVAEWSAASHLEALARALEHAGVERVRVVPIPDAPLHTSDLSFSASGSREHVAVYRKDLEGLGMDEHVLIPDTLESLPSEWDDFVRDKTRSIRKRIENDADFARDVATQTESLIYSINTLEYGWSTEFSVLVYAAIAGDVRLSPSSVRSEAAALHRRVAQVAPHYVAINHSIRELDLVSRVVEKLTGSPEHIRLSVHAKPSEPRPALATPNRFAPRAALLPMHSVGLWSNLADRSRFGGVFELSARLRGMRPVHEPQQGRFLFYEPIGDAVERAAQGLRAA